VAPDPVWVSRRRHKSLSAAGSRAADHPALSLEPAYFIVLVVGKNYGLSQI